LTLTNDFSRDYGIIAKHCKAIVQQLEEENQLEKVIDYLKNEEVQEIIQELSYDYKPFSYKIFFVGTDEIATGYVFAIDFENAVKQLFYLLEEKYDVSHCKIVGGVESNHFVIYEYLIRR